MERLATYSAAKDPVGLYKWNADLSSAFFELIGHAEVLLRNVAHNQLAPHSTDGRWFDDPYYPFTQRAKTDIKTAKQRANHSRKAATPGRVVAELTFGFWRYLFSSTYQTTLWPRVSHGLLGVLRHERNRQAFEQVVSKVHKLRNRVAHHEPIFNTNLEQHLIDLTDLAGYIDRQAKQWLQGISRVDNLLQQRPD